MHARTAQHPVWFVHGITPTACPLGAGLECEIPITRMTVIADGSPCHTGGRCAGHNHADPTVATQAKEELDWRTSH